MHETDILYNIKNYTEKGKIRVKFLDREDIEAEGWEQIEYDIYVFGLYVLEFNPEYYTYIYLASHKPDVIFKGKIRNRSELRKLMKQLNIE